MFKLKSVQEISLDNVYTYVVTLEVEPLNSTRFLTSLHGELTNRNYTLLSESLSYRLRYKFNKRLGIIEDVILMVGDYCNYRYLQVLSQERKIYIEPIYFCFLEEDVVTICETLTKHFDLNEKSKYDTIGKMTSDVLTKINSKLDKIKKPDAKDVVYFEISRLIEDEFQHILPFHSIVCNPIPKEGWTQTYGKDWLLFISSKSHDKYISQLSIPLTISLKKSKEKQYENFLPKEVTNVCFKNKEETLNEYDLSTFQEKRIINLEETRRKMSFELEENELQLKRLESSKDKLSSLKSKDILSSLIDKILSSSLNTKNEKDKLLIEQYESVLYHIDRSLRLSQETSK